MKVMILSGDYEEFLGWLYAQHPGLERQRYEQQSRVRNEAWFSNTDSYAGSLRRCGHQAWGVHVNNEFMQRAWAREHGVKVRADQSWQFRLRRGIVPWVSRVTSRQWMYPILAAQIKHYKPDVLLNQAMDRVSNECLREARPHVKLLVGEHAATRLPETGNWGVYDLVISSFPPTVDWFRLKGVRAETIRLGFDPRILACLGDGERRIPISFVGSFYPVHSARVEWLEYLCSKCEVKVWSPHTNHLSAFSPIRGAYVGSAWGIDMYRVLRDSFLTLNHHGSIPPYANNLRLFEATGVGTLLITDWKDNLHEMFDPGKEVVCYRSREECAEMIQYYLKHAGEREAIARAGQQRTLREHTYDRRMQEFADVVQRYL